MPTISRECPQCKKYAQIELNQALQCPHCQFLWARVESVDKIFESCPLCACRQFYLDKDFNQVLGCFIMLGAIALVPFTYGISLAVFALIDFFLRKKIKSMVVCYRCGAEFRGFTPPPHLKGFMHHIGLKYDKTRDAPFPKK
jgi:hypothetical protein